MHCTPSSPCAPRPDPEPLQVWPLFSGERALQTPSESAVPPLRVPLQQPVPRPGLLHSLPSRPQKGRSLPSGPLHSLPLSCRCRFYNPGALSPGTPCCVLPCLASARPARFPVYPAHRSYSVQGSRLSSISSGEQRLLPPCSQLYSKRQDQCVVYSE